MVLEAVRFRQIVNLKGRSFYISKKAVEWGDKARQLMTKHGLTNWSFCYNQRARACGCCWFGKKLIELSIHLVERNNPDEEILDTILHEIAHAKAFILNGHTGHGLPWKNACILVGANPIRCCGSDKVDMPIGPGPKYKAVCPSCSATYYWQRMRHTSYYCRNCGQGKGSLAAQKIR